MRKAQNAILMTIIASLLCSAAAVRSEDFELAGSGYYEIVTDYGTGSLGDTIEADILRGGYIEHAYVSGDAVLRILEYRYLDAERGPYGNSIYTGCASGNSVIEIIDGKVGDRLCMRNNSFADVSGGEIKNLCIHQSSKVEISGGRISRRLCTQHNSIVSMSGGQVGNICSHQDSRIEISGGNVTGRFCIQDNSVVDIMGGHIERLYSSSGESVDISGGQVKNLYARANSIVVIYGYDFVPGEGLSLDSDGKTVSGTGRLTGEWSDGTSWAMQIRVNDDSASIMVIE